MVLETGAKALPTFSRNFPALMIPVSKKSPTSLLPGQGEVQCSIGESFSSYKISDLEWWYNHVDARIHVEKTGTTQREEK